MALEMDMGTGGSSDSPEDWSLTGPNSKILGFFTISFGCHFHELSVVRKYRWNQERHGTTIQRRVNLPEVSFVMDVMVYIIPLATQVALSCEEL